MAAIKVQCSSCSTRLVLKDETRLGTSIKCPKCSTSFIARAPQPEADRPELGVPELDDESLAPSFQSPAKRLRRSEEVPSTRKADEEATAVQSRASRRTTRKKQTASRRGWIVGLGALACVLVLAGVAVLISMTRGSGDASTAAAPSPRVVTEVYQPLKREPMVLPDWLVQDAPFDAQAFWTTVPEEENAAALYLDALYEFSPEVEIYFPPEVRAEHSPAIRDRFEGGLEFQKAWESNKRRITAERDLFLDQHAVGLRKFEEAQIRPRCQFEFGWDIAAYGPAVQAFREVLRVSRFDVERRLEVGDFDAVVRRIAMILRLSRDMRTRGALLAQLVADAIDSVTFASMVTAALKSPRIEARHCQELQTLLTRHHLELVALEPYVTGLRSDHIRRRLVLHDLQHQTGEFAEDRFGRAFGAVNPTRGAALLAWQTYPSPNTEATREQRDLLDALLSNMQESDYQANIAWEKESYTVRANAAPLPFAERVEATKPLAETERVFQRQVMDGIPRETPKEQVPKLATENLRRKLAEGTLQGPSLSLLLEGQFERQMYSGNSLDSELTNQTRLQGTRGLVALRYWYATQSAPPPDFATLCRHAGLTDVPQDLFVQQPLRLVTFTADTPLEHARIKDRKALAGETILYSVGPDGVDSKARHEYDLTPRSPGDLLFRLEAPQSAFPRTAQP